MHEKFKQDTSLMGRIKNATLAKAKVGKNLKVLSPGDICGESSLIDGRKNQLSAIAIEYCDLLMLDHTDLHEVMEKSPEVKKIIIRTIASRNRLLREKRGSGGNIANSDLPTIQEKEEATGTIEDEAPALESFRSSDYESAPSQGQSSKLPPSNMQTQLQTEVLRKIYSKLEHISARQARIEAKLNNQERSKRATKKWDFLAMRVKKKELAPIHERKLGRSASAYAAAKKGKLQKSAVDAVGAIL
eukprot:g2068.t1